MTGGTAFYPIHLDLRGRLCVILGGSAAMEEKVRGLMRAGARVTLIAETLTPELQHLVETGSVEHQSRGYRPGDLVDAALAIGEGGRPATNEILRLEARTRNIPLNIIDDPSNSSFIAPATVIRGDLCVAISTSGKAPAMAVRLRQHLEAHLGAEHSEFLRLAGQIRPLLAERHPEFGKRRAIWYQLVDSDILDHLRAGRQHRAVERISEIVGFSVKSRS